MRKILYTSKHGSGWTTNNIHIPQAARVFMAEYPPLVKHIENGGKIEDEDLKENESGEWISIIKSPIIQQMVDEMQKRWPGIEVNTSSANHLSVKEVADHYPVMIEEYDGRETVYECDEVYV